MCTAVLVVSKFLAVSPFSKKASSNFIFAFNTMLGVVTGTVANTYEPNSVVPWCVLPLALLL